VALSGRTPPTRGYSMGTRSSAVDETRLAITEATMRLHERVGPRSTTVSAIAGEARVTRVTVYKHFPNEEALVAACSTHWGLLHPRPDAAAWLRISDPVARLRTALHETYEWAATAAPMMVMIYRDLNSLPGFVAEFLAADEKKRIAALVRGFRARGAHASRLSVVIRHALRITTWQSLCAEGGLTSAEAIDVMVGAVLAVTPTYRA
jgi:AcrR family transcriptional regulator